MSGPSSYWWRQFRQDPLTTLDFIEEPIAGDRARGRLPESARWALALVLLCLMATAPKWWQLLFAG